MSSPRVLKGVGTTVGQGSPSAGSRKPHMPPAVTLSNESRHHYILTELPESTWD